MSAFVVFALDHQRVGLPLDHVQRSIRAVAITPLPGAPALVTGIIDLAGTVIPVVDIRARFDLPSRALRLSDQLLIAVTARRTVALLVDDTLGVVESTAAKLAPSAAILPGLEVVSGALTCDDGLILIHDLDRLLSFDEEEALDAALDAAPVGTSSGQAVGTHSS